MNEIDRRRFIQHSGLAGLGMLFGLGGLSCAPNKEIVDPNGHSLGYRKLPKAKIAPDLVIKETVGLRPYRLSGACLKADKLDEKTIVHNYGHGGSGFSLSWGTAMIAANMVRESGYTEIAVIGGGIIGLTTARTLQNRGCKVRIYAKELFPNHTSSLATGTWSPAHLFCEEERITPQLINVWEEACRYSFRSYQNLLGLNNDMVQWVNHYVIGGKTHIEASGLHLDGLLPERFLLSKNKHPFREKQIVLEKTMVFNIPSYLDYLTREFIDRGGELSVQEFHSVHEMLALKEPLIVNCTGLGAKKLFNDDELIPISGQLAFLVPQPEINFRLSTPNGYFIPRRDGLVLGGNAIRGSWNTEPKKEVTLNIIKALNDIVQHMRA
ncbi:FAD-binding oxidoreductase [Olivibacter sp. SDN3]|uniref:FAD-dependent oxidoreductase n=1 Tax=Olivibacter sp. SDN3 TaxID=2764720 RepID=UPI0016518FCA|nr:FAD-dependent oxidoreductase [Olivibacter sp. SDN3]QNL52639.1 FAD-binding oxidoreductase [Olivibacter sp. SDN3]